MTEAKQQPFQAEVTRVLGLVINSLYSNPDIFLRELISNASDALDKLRYASLQEPDLLGDDARFVIRLTPDPGAGTLTISDNGIGMSAEELARNLGTIAWSGSREFLDRLEQAQKKDNLELIGQFGVGFYSAYLVAERVDVVSRAAGSSEANRWSSDGKEGFSIEPAERAERGTAVVLHLKEDARQYLDAAALRRLVERYSDYLSHPIEVGERPAAGGEPDYKVVNRASALWQRSPKEIEKQQYEEFYKHLTHDWEAPLTWQHFKIEGTQMFAGLLFVPRRRPFDLFDAQPRHGVRLHVKRVMVMDQCEELVPRWLRFVRGVIDTEDLPLNVSRELLQDSKAVKVIKKQVVQQTLEALKRLADERPDDYVTFWENFGAVLKEGLHFEPDQAERLLPLLRYESSKRSGLVSLADYVAALPDGQKDIYYLSAASKSVLEHSPHLEGLRQRGYEVLFMSDAVDPFAMQSLREYDGKKFVDAIQAGLSFGEAQDDAQKDDARGSGVSGLLERFERVLSDRVEKVLESKRLTDSPACLVVPEGGIAPHLERMLRAQQLNLPPAKRILELNLGHPLLCSIAELDAAEPGSDRIRSWVELIYAQALLAEGSPLEDSAGFAQRLSRLFTTAARAEADRGRGASEAKPEGGVSEGSSEENQNARTDEPDSPGESS